MPRLTIACPYPPNRAPSQRYRFEQYIAWLQQNGFEVQQNPALSAEAYHRFHASGGVLAKAKLLWGAISQRKKELAALRKKRADLVLVHREALLTGQTFFERGVHKLQIPLVFDFDDAIWMQNVSAANRRFAFLKNPAKTAALCKMADLVTVGNEFLAQYARQFNTRVEIVPSTIDTEYYLPPPPKPAAEPVVIGWTGSVSTIPHFEQAIPALETVLKEFGPERVRIRLIGQYAYQHPNLPIEFVRWNAATEVADLAPMDIGIMPLLDEEWAKGKCGMKGLQYMAMGISTVMSPVGVNSQIIQHGINGHLATTTDEWIAVLMELIRSPELRQRTGQLGRQTVQEQYSVQSQRNRYLELYRGVLN
jgi:glycosyltransferase involved in cell wall biosynthesis